MNPLTGRFWTTDSYEGSLVDPATLHKYMYANGDGVNMSDPSGYMTFAEIQLVSAQIAGAAIRVYTMVYARSIWVLQVLVGENLVVGGGVVFGAKAGQAVLPKLIGGLKTIIQAVQNLRNSQKIGRYKDVAAALKGTGNQANHLNQHAAFKARIPHDEGIAAEIGGDILQPGSPHNIFHRALEMFWEPFRKSGKTPTVGEYNKALGDALESAGHSLSEADALVDLAKANQLAHGIGPSDFVPTVPEKFPYLPE